jgi:hypothetical protein
VGLESLKSGTGGSFRALETNNDDLGKEEDRRSKEETKEEKALRGLPIITATVGSEGAWRQNETSQAQPRFTDSPLEDFLWVKCFRTGNDGGGKLILNTSVNPLAI